MDTAWTHRHNKPTQGFTDSDAHKNHHHHRCQQPATAHPQWGARTSAYRPARSVAARTVLKNLHAEVVDQLDQPHALALRAAARRSGGGGALASGAGQSEQARANTGAVAARAAATPPRAPTSRCNNAKRARVHQLPGSATWLAQLEALPVPRPLVLPPRCRVPGTWFAVDGFTHVRRAHASRRLPVVSRSRCPQHACCIGSAAASGRRRGTACVLSVALPLRPLRGVVSCLEPRADRVLSRHWFVRCTRARLRRQRLACAARLCQVAPSLAPEWLVPLPLNSPVWLHRCDGRRLDCASAEAAADAGGVRVTLINANHCPGAVMFLFEVPRACARCRSERAVALDAVALCACGFAPTAELALPHSAVAAAGEPSARPAAAQPAAADAAAEPSSEQERVEHAMSVLHCGDMRLGPEMLREPALARLAGGAHAGVCGDDPCPGGAASGGVRGLHWLFLDTTFADPRFVFPPRQTMVDFVAERAEAFLRGGCAAALGSGAGGAACAGANAAPSAAERSAGGRLVLVGVYSIGKERILAAIARRCPGERIYCAPAQVRALACMHPLRLLVRRATTLACQSTCGCAASALCGARSAP